MTVSELITILAKFPLEAEVVFHDDVYGDISIMKGTEQLAQINENSTAEEFKTPQ